MSMKLSSDQYDPLMSVLGHLWSQVDNEGDVEPWRGHESTQMTLNAPRRPTLLLSLLQQTGLSSDRLKFSGVLEEQNKQH